ncbi:unnamed protein product [Didymodactylos carnosus]|uniref:Uncharacterized protein n=2 Tax=Didymodactylos carnosus TaxID=1234261 RepID=A0A815ATW4_9BILA|nr:unnamed protein product [Didymodactylos carnosus]CAF4039028.1 unnamed protein product [Didymodactylos carnosus]
MSTRVVPLYHSAYATLQKDILQPLINVDTSKLGKNTTAVVLFYNRTVCAALQMSQALERAVNISHDIVDEAAQSVLDIVMAVARQREEIQDLKEKENVTQIQLVQKQEQAAVAEKAVQEEEAKGSRCRELEEFEARREKYRNELLTQQNDKVALDRQLTQYAAELDTMSLTLTDVEQQGNFTIIISKLMKDVAHHLGSVYTPTSILGNNLTVVLEFEPWLEPLNDVYQAMLNNNITKELEGGMVNKTVLQQIQLSMENIMEILPRIPMNTIGNTHCLLEEFVNPYPEELDQSINTTELTAVTEEDGGKVTAAAGNIITVENSTDLVIREDSNATTTSTTATIGHLDGRGFAVLNFLYLGDELDVLTSSKKSAAGLIRTATNANIRNIRMENCQITSGNSRIGCLVGSAVSTLFHRVGVLKGSQVTCTGDAILNAAWACGGLVGGVTTSATLSECFSQAEVDGGRVYLTGGLVGGQPGGKHTAADFVIENSYSAGSVSGYRYVGGLTGGTTGGSNSNYYASLYTNTSGHPKASATPVAVLETIPVTSAIIVQELTLQTFGASSIPSVSSASPQPDNHSSIITSFERVTTTTATPLVHPVAIEQVVSDVNASVFSRSPPSDDHSSITSSLGTATTTTATSLSYTTVQSTSSPTSLL